MSLLLIGGFLFLIILLFRRSFLTKLVSPINSIVLKLSTSSWFHHSIWSGLFLFHMNALLFGITAALLYLLTYFFIPYLHLAIMLLAILASLFVWISIYHADTKNKKDRLIMSFIGSGFYLLLFAYAVFRIFMPTIGVGASENDQFMEFIGMFFLSIIAFTAWIVCFVITGLYCKQKQ